MLAVGARIAKAGTGVSFVRPADTRGAARCATKVLDRGVQAIFRGAAGCALQVLDRFARPIPAAALVVAKVLDRGAQAVARGAARYASEVFIAAPGRCPRRPSLCVAGT